MSNENRILVVKPGQHPAEAEKIAEAEQQIAAQRQMMEAQDLQTRTCMSQVVRALFMSFARTHTMAIEVCLEHIAQLAIMGGIDRKQLVAMLFERCNVEEEAHEKRKGAQRTSLVNALQSMRAQGLKVPPNVMGQLNLLEVELEPELKEWLDNNQAPQNQLATAENLHGLPPGSDTMKTIVLAALLLLPVGYSFSAVAGGCDLIKNADRRHLCEGDCDLIQNDDLRNLCECECDLIQSDDMRNQCEVSCGQ